ncbi:hypothetical protein WOLCODRAFT_86235 [Wolfiporia cocos MD-104 SS10]|uniref:Uncharacterized protein n=1 Tax=Wolfiporia cocos (strain MD-104) TaxID=742152 RepID=A0A2H3K4I8_WOLCO|nr:hypothetical protein WOLCODRAFT_86235 [Wolfiporia cocos MD-104 SS10]
MCRLCGCVACYYVQALLSPHSLSKHNKSVVNEVTTMRRHLQSAHSGSYREWAAKSHFISMLPNDIKKRKDMKLSQKQTRLDPHLRERAECIPPYSHLAFRQAAIEWLVATDQPIQALEHPAFRNMIQIASRATGAVVIANRRQTRQEIVDLFKRRLMLLRQKLLVRFLHYF